jgi:hypothetical protein
MLGSVGEGYCGWRWPRQLAYRDLTIGKEIEALAQYHEEWLANKRG